jgi:Uma2 family endonuclease
METVADLLDRLGVPPDRIRLYPAPGTATEADVLASIKSEKRLCELVDGVLVEKPMGFYESVLAGILIGFLRAFLEQHDLGILSVPDGTVRLVSGLVRIPDVAFFSWDRFPNRELPSEAIPDLVPDLAVEVLSEGNTEAEMERKLQEYFGAGVRLVWYVDPRTRTAQIDTSPGSVRLALEDDALDGGAVLPGFRLRLRELFDRAGTRRTP